MRRLRPLILLALVASFAAPGTMAMGLHRSLEPHLSHGRHHAGGADGHSHAHEAAPDAAAERAATLARAVLHGHHHSRTEPDHDHPAVRSGNPTVPQLRRAHESVPSVPASGVSPAAGSTPGLTAARLGRVSGDLGASHRGPVSTLSGTLLSRFCSLLL